MQRLSDIALIAQVVTLGSERAFGQLVRAHQEAVRRFLLRLTAGDEMRADDLAQETFIRAWQSLSSFRQLSGFETWLFKIAFRVFLDEQRKSKETADTFEEAVKAPMQPESFSLRYDLDRALSTLSQLERTCVVLQCVEGQSIKEITQITGIPENTVKSHLLRGKKNLANYLRKNGYNG
ncbi:MAG: RNA polymerase sigma factor [Bacteroidaceae bacterium]|nr:RNA polymerase sigma factor [Bacteroidaceae bacterium]